MKMKSGIIARKRQAMREVMYPNLPDERLNKRLEIVVEQLSQAPEQGIPQACGSLYDSKAA